MLADLTIKDFLAETAGSAPVPGGGSISALNGAIAAGVAILVSDKTDFKPHRAEKRNAQSLVAHAHALLRST